MICQLVRPDHFPSPDTGQATVGIIPIQDSVEIYGVELLLATGRAAVEEAGSQPRKEDAAAALRTSRFKD